jgi:adenylate cyclase
MASTVEQILGKRVGGTRVVPLATKILVLFTVFLLISNFATSYIGLTLNRGEQMRILNQLLVKDLKDLYLFASSQSEIYDFNKDLPGALKSMAAKGLSDLRGQKSLALGVKLGGELTFQASRTVTLDRFTDEGALARMLAAKDTPNPEGSFTFRADGAAYIGVFRYHPKWDMFLIRAEEMKEFSADSWKNFWNTSFVILVMTVVCVLVGGFLMRRILRFVRSITDAIMKMQESKSLELIDLARAPNDDVTYLGVAFNSLSSEIANLMTIFRKFATQDLVNRAYRDRFIRLEGKQEELTVLFTDIKGFTFITEKLGTDIIKLLNLHYEHAIAHIHEEAGIIGSIIGDALLAVFGTLSSDVNKSVHSVRAAYEIQHVAAQLRQQMHQRREEIIQERGALTDKEEDIYRAVLLEVGVGIDGGSVFYGTIGSNNRMTNTVIGDNVNSSSRLEGLTRIYKVPVICSEYVKEEVETSSQDFHFLELDQVQVKGKTVGKRVYWPIPAQMMTPELKKDIELFSKGLKLYYQGQWPKASKLFRECTLPLAEEFRDRTVQARPKNWSGIWQMTTK